MTPQELKDLQKNDPTLAKARKVADGQRSTEAGDGFFWKNDLLYRRWTPIGCNEEMVIDQIVLPKSCHQQGTTPRTHNPIGWLSWSQQDSAPSDEKILLGNTISRRS